MNAFLNSVWRSAACLAISLIAMGVLGWLAVKATPVLFQDSTWAKIGILCVGLEIGAGVLYFAIIALSGLLSMIAKRSKVASVISTLPILLAVVRYPIWLYSCSTYISHSLGHSLGFMQWLIIISWMIIWVVGLLIAIGGILGNAWDDSDLKTIEE